MLETGKRITKYKEEDSKMDCTDALKALKQEKADEMMMKTGVLPNSRPECAYQMMVIGEEENIQKFLRILDPENEGGLDFNSVYDMKICAHAKEGEALAVIVQGKGAWSARRMFIQKYQEETDENGQLLYTTVPQQSKELSLEIIVNGYSCDEIEYFLEEYHYVNGEEVPVDIPEMRFLDQTMWDGSL